MSIHSADPAQVNPTTAIVRDPLVLTPEATVRAAIASMGDMSRQPETVEAIAPRAAQHRAIRSSCVVLVEAGQVVGLLTERDVVRFCGEHSPPGQTIREVMAPVTLTLKESALTDAAAAAALLHHHQISHVPVVDDNHFLVGLLTAESLLPLLLPKAPRTPLQTEAAHEKRLLEIATHIRNSLDLHTILDTTVAQVRQVLGCDRVIIYQFHPDWSGTIIAESVLQAEHSILQQQGYDPCTSPAWRATYQQGQVQVVRDIYNEAMALDHRTMLVNAGIRAKLVMPIVVEGALWGLVVASDSKQPRDWQPSEVELLQMLSVQVALALRQALMYHQLQTELAERQRTETALQESEQRFRAIFDNMFQFIGLLATDGILLEANRTALSFSDVTIAEVIGKPFWECPWWQISPETQAQLQRAISRAAQGEFVRYEVEVWGANQTVVPFDFSLRPIFDQEGRVTLLIPEGRDLTDLKHRESALAASEARSRAMLAVMPDLLIRVDGQGYCHEILSLNHPLEIFTHHQGRLGYHLTEVLPAHLAEQQIQVIRQVLATHQVRTYEHEIQVGDQVQQEEVRVVRCSDDEALVLVRDISDRKRSEVALRQSEAHQRALVSALPDLLVRLNADGIYLEFAASPIFPVVGVLPELVGTHVSESLPPAAAQQRMEAIQRALATRTIQFYEQDLSTNGQMRIEEVRIVPYTDNEVLALVRDISEKAQLDVERQQAEQQLLELNQSLERKVEERTAALRESEAQIRAMVAAIPDLLMRVSRDGRCLSSSYPDKQANPFVPKIQAHLSEVLSPDLLQQQLTAVDQALATGQLQVYEQQLQRGDLAVHEEVRIQGLNADEALIIVRDITERKQTEAENQHLRDRLEFLLSSSPAIIYSCTIGSHLEATFISQNVTTILGYQPETIISVPGFWQSRVHPDDAPKCLTEMTMLLQQEHQCLEYRVLHQDGYYVWLRDEMCLVRNAEGEPSEVIGYCADISDRKRAEAELERLSQRLSFALESGAIGCWDWNLQNNTIVWDERMYALYGLLPRDGAPAGQVPYKDWAERLHSDDRKTIETLLHQALLGEAKYDTEFRVIHPDGTLHYIKGCGKVVRDPQGKPLAMIGVNFDISDRKRAEQALVESRQFIETVIQTIPLPLFWKDKDSVFLGCNHLFASFRGLPSPSDIVGKTDFDLSSTDAEARAYQADDRRVIETGQAKTVIEETLTLPNGQVIWLETYKSPLRNWRGTIIGMVGMFQDITKRKQAEQIMRQQNEELLRATRLKDEFLANMSHELRTPLNAILGMTEGLQDQVFGQVNDQQLNCLNTIESSASHLLALINDILDVAKIESGQMDLNLVPTAIGPLCQDSLTFVKQQAFTKRIQLELKTPINLPELLIDERRIRQVLINLLTNAVKFTPQGGQVILTVSQVSPLESATNQHFIRFAISDTGIGIAPENIPKLFQPFIQIDSALNRQYQGTGLGLVLVKRIVEKHGGQVHLISEVGVGSCFTIDLPCTPGSMPVAQDLPAGRETPGNNPGDGLAQAEKLTAPLILLAEDQDANIITTTSYLTARGYCMVLAKTGHEAIHMAQTRHPDLILMDIQMPGMDGLEAIQQIRCDLTLIDTPIIALTALTMEGDQDRCLAAGANAYLSKPVRLKQLATLIQQQLSQRSSP